ncbi:thiamine pyrophosphate-binding protein [Salibacterium halotolerans]|uniref:Acetolactate synthase-1/2/3 large subunit n=1 Tax=Salibacterium halotolerans TaxID=1884432 RepID=A0A1I5PEA5_9BACI|nr:thiamine pyrophosphate-binding protein [Salibacterium halotolerans]SFP31826.1 acetolactate synthase-1/2/3 large subunit [Salibacterium halotolerans]
MPKVSSMIVEQVMKMGCRHAFGIPGKPVVPLILEMEAQGMDFVLTRHEGGGGYIAAGYAMQHDTLGLAVGTSGPGGTNLLTAAGQAKAYHAPVLIITGHPPLQETGKALGQDSSMFGTDLTELFKPVTKFSAKVEDSRSLKNYLHHAFQKALTGEKGPVHLSIPLDVLTAEVEPFDLSGMQMEEHMVSMKLTEMENALQEARQPVMLLGKGVHIAGAYEEVRQAAEQWDIPVMTTPGGKGTFPTKHPLSLGGFGLGGTLAANAYLQEGADVMVVIGSTLSDMSIAGLNEAMYPEKIIQLDYNETFAGKSLPVETTLVKGDAKTNLRYLLDHAKTEEPPETRDLAPYWEEETIAVSAVINNEKEKHSRLSTAAVMAHLRELLPGDTVVYGDDGSHTFYGIKYFDTVQAGTFFFDDVFGAMGHGIGFSIGAKVAAPEKNIACFTGDGCMLMHGTEVSTAVNQQAGVLFFVFNNGMLDMVDKGMKNNLGRSAGVRYDTDMNAALFGESLGAASVRCTTMEEIETACRSALLREGPTVIEIVVDKEETPPTMARG